MKRILLVHWQEAEAQARAQLLRAGGYEVTVFSGGTIVEMRAIREDPPDGFVIDLDRTPSRGLDLGVWLRQQKATRPLPLVFAGGSPDKVERARNVLPDAAFAAWPDILPALAGALAQPPQNPVAPGLMAGYSGTPLPKKLGIRPGSCVALLGAPEGFAALVQPLPEGARLRADLEDHPDVIVLFARSLAELEQRFPAAAGALARGGKLWIAWPKKTSGVATDLKEPVVRAYGLDAGWVDYKISAIDATWSGLCFARRNRE